MGDNVALKGNIKCTKEGPCKVVMIMKQTMDVAIVAQFHFFDVDSD